MPDLAGELTALLARVSQVPKTWKTARRDLALDRPLIMGILNVTPDSFSDGGTVSRPAQGSGTRPGDGGGGGRHHRHRRGKHQAGAPQVPAAEELRRISPVIEQLAGRLSCPISVDTWKGEVAKGALAAGAEIINDISGFGLDPAMAPVAAGSGAGVVLMHTRGTPDRMQSNTVYEDLLGDIIAGLRCSLDSAVSAGVERERIVIDPGIGFAKDSAANLEILRRLREFASLGLPLLVGTSRKSFIGKTLGRVTGERMVGTAATVALAVANGADILRVHDVRAMREAADMAHAIVTS